MATYTLEIYKSEDNSKILTLTYDSVPKGDQVNDDTFNQVKINGESFPCKLLELQFIKNIYQPGFVFFKFQVNCADTGSGKLKITDLFTLFQDTYLNLEGEKGEEEQEGEEEKKGGGDTQSVAEKYHLFEIRPEIKVSSTSTMNVTIFAYSPDKFLTLDKYCKAFTGKKLFQEIVCNTVNWPTRLPQEIKDGSKINLNLIQSDLQHIAVPKKTSEEKVKEYIQPYLVQYNESFFDFLVRVMNRCGEFFFFENGAFHFGWIPGKGFEIKKYQSVQLAKSISTAWNDNEIGYIHDNYNYMDMEEEQPYRDIPRQKDYIEVPDKDDSSKMKQAAYVKKIDSEVANDENLTPIPSEGKYTSWEEFALWPGAFWVSTVSDALGEKTLFEMVSSVVVEKSLSVASSTSSSSDTNKNYKEVFFSKNKESDGSDESDERYQERMDGENKIHLYSTTVTSGTEPFSLAFYSEIEQNIKRGELERASIDLGEHFYPDLALGAKVTFDGVSYVVVKIVGNILSDCESVQIDVLPEIAGTYYPPLASVGPVRTASAQRAFVTNNNDPMRMNRVRVRFPWQAEGDDPSPWIRIAQPMASDGSGFNFIPEVGDEAIVNFENGNIEKPYVEGLFYSADRKPSYTYKRNNMRSISSRNGHSIIFYDKDKGSEILKSFSSFASIFGNYIPGLKFEGSEGLQKATGGMEFTDEYGFYSISMSSDKRKISIDSPLGSVSMNAFTGITISAPNGDISIQGKNISLMAGNNITIESGINKQTDYWPNLKKMSGGGIVNKLTKAVTAKLFPIDMKLVRTLVETFLRPIGGTMLIKSNRYLLFEAGKGKATILNSLIIANFSKKEALKRGRGTLFFNKETLGEANGIYNHEVFRCLVEATRFIEGLFYEHESITNQILSSRRELTQYSDFLNGNIMKNKLTAAPKYFKDIVDDVLNRQGVFQKIKVKEGEENNVSQRSRAILRFYNTISRKLYDNIPSYSEDAIWDQRKGALSQSLQDIITGDIEQKIRDIYGPIYWKKHINIIMTGITIDKPAEREVLYLILEELVKKQYSNQTYSFILPGKPKDFQDGNWEKFVKKISDSTSVKMKIKDGILEGLNFQGFLDQYVWDKETDEGKILFSDEAGVTLDFKNQQIHHYHQNQDKDLLQNLQNLLKSI